MFLTDIFLALKQKAHPLSIAKIALVIIFGCYAIMFSSLFFINTLCSQLVCIDVSRAFVVPIIVIMAVVAFFSPLLVLFNMRNVVALLSKILCVMGVIAWCGFLFVIILLFRSGVTA